MVGVSFKISKTGTRYRPKAASAKSPLSNEDKVSLQENSKAETPSQATSSCKRMKREVALVKMSGDLVAYSLSSASSEGCPIKSEHGVSFAVNLFLDGFSIGKPTEIGKSPPSADECTETVHPYDRASETIFQAIDGGWLPGNILEDIPCKYVDGNVVCEVRDYCRNSPISGDSVSSREEFPVVKKVPLRLTMENIVKDISFMVEDCWAYSDLIEIESRILKAVQPKLCLDPTPRLERLCENPKSNKLNLGVPMARCQRMQMGGVASVKVMRNNVSHGKKVSIEGSIEKATSQSGTTSTNSVLTAASVSCVQENPLPVSSVVSNSIPLMRSKIWGKVESGHDLTHYGVLEASQPSPLQTGLTRSRHFHAEAKQLAMPSSLTTCMSFASSSIQDGTNSVMDARSGAVSLLGQRDIRDAPTTTKPDTKKSKQEQTCPDKFQQQNLWPKIDTKLIRDCQIKDNLMQWHQSVEAVHFSDVTFPRHPQQLMKDVHQKALGEVSQRKSKLSFQLDQSATRELKVTEEWPGFERGQIVFEQGKQGNRNKDDHVMELDNDQPDQQQLLSQCFPQSGKVPFHAIRHLQNVGQPMEKECKVDDLLQKRKLVQDSRPLPMPEVRGLVQYPASPKSGGLLQPLTLPTVLGPSVGPSHNNIAASVAFGPQEEKSQGMAAMAPSVAFVNPSQTDSSLDQLVQSSMPCVRKRSNLLPKTSPVTGVGLLGSVPNSMAPSNANSPSTGKAAMPSSGPKTDQSIVVQGQNKQAEDISSLVSKVQSKMQDRCDLLVRKDRFPEVKKAPPSGELISYALADSANSKDQMDAKGHSRPPSLQQTLSRLIITCRVEDEMIDEEFGDGQNDISLIAFPCDLPNLASTLENEGYKPIDDQAQSNAPWPSLPQNASSSTHSIAFGASILGSNVNQLPSSSLIMASQSISSAATLCGIPPPNPYGLAVVQMPPPANTPSEQLSAAYTQAAMVTSLKPLQLDPASQLALVHDQQQQQQQHQVQQHQPQLQSSHPLVTVNQLGQLNATNHNCNRQMNTQKMIPSGSMGGLGGMAVGNMSGVTSMSGGGMTLCGGGQGGLSTMVGLSGMNGVMGVAGISGISASTGGKSNLAKPNQLSSIGGIGQMPGIGNMTAQQLQPCAISQAQSAAALATKQCIAQGRGRPGAIGSPSIRNTIESMSVMPASNQVHNYVGLSMVGRTLGRGNVSFLQRAVVAVINSLKVAASMIGVPGQNFHLNQQLNNQQQQINSQQQLSQQLNPQQQLNSQLLLTPQQLCIPSSQQPQSSQPSLNIHQQLNQQQHIVPQQQLNPQSQMNSQQQFNPQQLGT